MSEKDAFFKKQERPFEKKSIFQDNHISSVSIRFGRLIFTVVKVIN